MNLSWISWINSPTKDKGRHMAAFLEYVPVKLYGFSAQSIVENKPMNLLQLFLYDKAEAYHKDLPQEAEFPGDPENWGEKDREKAWTMLHRIEDDPGMYPMPVRCLPELGRWVCKRTRNIILDYHFDPRLNGPRFRWDSPDLEQLKLAWRRAKPIVQQQKKLTEWYERDPSRLVLLTRFLIGADSYEQLDW
jgi:hypothetical protein